MRVKGAANFQSNVQLFKGRFQVYGHPKLGLIVTKWPRKRGKKGTQGQKDQRALFAQAIAWARQPLASDVAVADEITKGSGYLPRDVIESACFGLVVIARLKSGKIYYGRRMVATDIQASLDSISNQVGAVLYRGPDGWVGLDPGLEEQVLTISTATAMPVWADAAGSGGGPFEIPIGSATITLGGNTVHLSAAPIAMPTGGGRLKLQMLQTRPAARTQGIGIFQLTGGNAYFSYWGPSNENNLYRFNAGTGTSIIVGGTHAAPVTGSGYLHEIQLSVIGASSNAITILTDNLYSTAWTADTHVDLTTGVWYVGVVDNTDITTVKQVVAYTGAF